MGHHEGNECTRKRNPEICGSRTLASLFSAHRENWSPKTRNRNWLEKIFHHNRCQSLLRFFHSLAIWDLERFGKSFFWQEVIARKIANLFVELNRWGLIDWIGFLGNFRFSFIWSFSDSIWQIWLIWFFFI